MRFPCFSLLLAGAAAALGAAPAAAGWAGQYDARAGSGGFYRHTLGFVRPLGRRLSLAADASVWSRDAQDAVAPSFSANLSTFFGRTIVAIRPILYFETDARSGSAKGGAVALSRGFEDRVDPDSPINVSLIGTYISHDTEHTRTTGVERVKMSETAVTVMLEKDWFGHMVVRVAGTGFFFDRGFGDLLSSRTVFDQLDAGSWASLGSRDEYPAWTTHLHLVRASSDEGVKGSYWYLDYERTEFRFPDTHAHAFGVGLDFMLQEAWRMRTGYSHLRKIGLGHENIFQFAFSFLRR